MAWSDTISRYELKEKADGKNELSVDANTAIFENRQAVADSAHAWSAFDQETSLSANSTNKQGSKESLVLENTDFPRKARNTMLIKVAIGVLSWTTSNDNTIGNMFLPSPNVSLNCTHKALTEMLEVRLNICLFRAKFFDLKRDNSK